MKLFPWRKPTPTPAPSVTPVPFTRPEMVIVQYFDGQKEPREKVVTAAKYAELLQLAKGLTGDYSIAFNNHLAAL